MNNDNNLPIAAFKFSSMFPSVVDMFDVIVFN